MEVPLSHSAVSPLPAPAAAVEVAAIAPARRVFSVSRVVQRADQVLREKAAEPLWVRGEVSNWTRARSGHCYFTLRDDRSQLSCVMFSQEARAMPALPENGMEVEVLGTIGIYAERGQFQLSVSRVESTGIGGMWQVAVDRLLRQLRGEGLLDESRKRPLPACPDRVGVVTSQQGAAFQDMFRALRRKAWWVTVYLSPCTVEGVQAAPDVAAAIRRFGNGPGQCAVDVVIVARGGGSKESLWAFNHEEVARAIAACPFPVISAVGHETDHTVADQVADVRAATPTAGAERAVPEGGEILDWVRAFAGDARLPVLRRVAAEGRTVERTGRELRRAVERRLEVLHTHLGGAERHLAARSPQRLLESAAARVDDLEAAFHAAIRRRVSAGQAVQRSAEEALHGAIRRRVQAGWRDLAGAAEAIEARSPMRVLSRGYALVTDAESDRVVRRPAEVAAGQRLRIRLAEGEIPVRVEEPAPPAAEGTA